MDNTEVAKVCLEIATFLELKGENPFKVRAYANAGRTIENLQEDVADLVETERLTEIKGIGVTLAEKITELLATGSLKYHEDLKNSIPPGLIEMLSIPGLGPKKVNTIHEELKISSVGELEYACNENRLVELDGFGEKSQENILKGINNLKKYQKLRLYNSAYSESQEIIKKLKKNKNTICVTVAGSLRRKKEVVKDIDMVVASKKNKSIMEDFVSDRNVDSIVSHGKTKSSVILKSGINVDLRVVSKEEFPFALHHFTGSKEHNTEMRNLAKKKGMKMNEYGLFKRSKLLPCSDEKEIFEKLGLAYVPPELREGLGEVEAAGKKKIPDLIEKNDIQGIFHVHTNYSDGNMTLEEIVKKCGELGYHYVGISDHSEAAYYANGLKEDDIIRQRKEIKEINKKLKGFEIFHGIEADILPDGQVDYGPKILSEFDFVIASVHSSFTMKENEMTERLIKAIENPHVTMLGHPTGRLLLAREPYQVNMKKVIDAAKANKVMIELNSNPHRLDLDWKWCRYAKEKKVKISINPDAHSLEGLTHADFGVHIARKGWLTKKDCFNSLSADEVKAYLASKKKG